MALLANAVKLVFWGTLLAVGAFALNFFSGIFTFFGRGDLAEIVDYVPVYLLPIGMVLGMVGRIMCLAVPKRIGAKRYIFPAVFCDLTSVGLRIAILVTNLSPLYFMLSIGLWLASLTLFLLFLMAVARYMEEPHLVTEATLVIMLVIICVAATIALVFVPTLLLVFAGLGTMLVATFKYMNLLQHVAETVRP